MAQKISYVTAAAFYLMTQVVAIMITWIRVSPGDGYSTELNEPFDPLCHSIDSNR